MSGVNPAGVAIGVALGNPAMGIALGAAMSSDDGPPPSRGDWIALALLTAAGIAAFAWAALR